MRGSSLLTGYDCCYYYPTAEETACLITITATRILITNATYSRTLCGQAVWGVTKKQGTRDKTPLRVLNLRHALDDSSVAIRCWRMPDALSWCE